LGLGLLLAYVIDGFGKKEDCDKAEPGMK